MNKIGLLLLLSSLVSTVAYADPNFAEVRVALVGTLFSPKPDQLNTVTAPSSVDEIKGITGAMLEGSQPLLSWVKVGIRGGGNYNKITALNNAGGSSNPYFIAAQQTWISGILRLSLVQTKILRMDVFGEAGYMKNTIDTRLSAGEGTYTSENPFTRFGASAAIGWDKYFLFVEAGPESNKLSNLNRSGVTDPSITSIDFSGTFYAVGLFFNGIPGLIHNAK